MKKIMFNDKYGLTKAVLEGRKTQTRRVITYPKTFHGKDVCGYYVCRRATDRAITEVCMYDENESFIDEGQILPKYKAGEVVAVAQSYRDCGGLNEIGISRWDIIKQQVGSANAGWDNKMFVKPELMIHFIRITKVRIERLQDISDEDCLAEGVIKWDAGQTDVPFFSYPNAVKCDYDSPQGAYASLIDKVGKKGDWDSNPWVWAYTFELVK